MVLQLPKPEVQTDCREGLLPAEVEPAVDTALVGPTSSAAKKNQSWILRS